MFIKQIKGTYGIFRNQQIEFENGLNVISRDNEWGKTTLISLIKVMFFGLNTSKRDKKDSLSEKSKYTDNGSFSGEMILNYENEDLVISRTKLGKNSGFNAYYKKSGIKTHFSSSDFGKILFSMSEESFCNSALIEFDNRLIANSLELESLIVSMTTTGDISSNYEKAVNTLKNLKSNLEKSSGARNKSEKMLEYINFSIQKLEVIENELEILSAEKFNVGFILKEKNEEYEKKFRDVSMLKLEEEQRANIIKAQSEAILRDLEKDYYDINLINEVENYYEKFIQIRSYEYKYRVEFEELKAQIQKKKDELLKEQLAILTEQSKVVMHKIPFFVALIFGISTALSVFIDFNIGKFTPYASAILSVITIIALLFSFKRKGNSVEITKDFEKMLSELDIELNSALENQKNYADEIENSLNNLSEVCKSVSIYDIIDISLLPQKLGFLKDINKRYKTAISFKENTKDDNDIYKLEKILQVDYELSSIKTAYNNILIEHTNISNEIIKFQTKADEVLPLNQLVHKKSQLETELKNINSNINSLNIALEFLEIANEHLTSRLSPEISKKASEYLHFLTNNKYDTVILRKELEVFCRASENFELLDTLKLSSGTKEQLYFALRLAICDVLIDRSIPIILDDPFVFYDDKRMHKAIDLLKIISENRQILLFTCHTREQKYVSNM